MEHFVVETSYSDATSGLSVSRSTTVTSPLAVRAVPEDTLPSFSDRSVSKAFMMLNMYLMMRTSTQYYADGDCARAMGSIDLVDVTIRCWQHSSLADPDVQSDWELAGALRDVMRTECTAMRGIQPVAPISWSGGGGFGFFMD